MPLNSLAPLAAIGTQAQSDISKSASAVSSNAANIATGGLWSLSTLSPTRIVMVILGLLLIAAGIFSFDKTRELVVEGAKVAKTAAAAAA